MMYRKKNRRPLLKDKRLIQIKWEANKSNCLKLKPSAQIPWVLALTNFLTDLTNDPNHMGQVRRSPPHSNIPSSIKVLPKVPSHFSCALCVHIGKEETENHMGPKMRYASQLKKKKKKNSNQTPSPPQETKILFHL